MSGESLYLLGAPRVEYDGSIAKFDTRRALALFIYLVVTGEKHSRGKLVNLLWPESDHAHGRALLRSSLHSLRKVLGNGLIQSAHLNQTVGLASSRGVLAFELQKLILVTKGSLRHRGPPGCGLALTKYR